MFGCSDDEMIGQSAFKFLAPESHESAAQSASTLADSPMQYVGVRKDGSTFPVEILAREYLLHDRVVRVASVHDLTDRLAAEKALRESEARFRALIENASDFIIVIDRAATIRFVSPSVERMMGYSEEELVGHSSLDFVHPEDVAELAAIFQTRLIERGIGVPIEFRIIRSDGQPRILEVIANFNLLD